MCGIFGAVGKQCVKQTLDSLKNLEYRGYDSAGMSVKCGGRLCVEKVVGRVGGLEFVAEKYPSGINCIGHTRWATHGAPERRNAHPFASYGGNFAVVHNGVLDNWKELRAKLVAEGVEFTSDTDSEAIAHLLERNYDGDVLQCVIKTAKSLKGSYAVAVQTTFDDNLYVMKSKSPLVVGVGRDGVYVCSDVRCLSKYAERAAVLADGQIAVVAVDKIAVYEDGQEVRSDFFDVSKTDFAMPQQDIMLSEIFEIPHKIRAAKRGYIGGGRIGLSTKKIRGFDKIYLLGCGTAYHSGLQTAAVARKMVDLDVIAVTASEFVYDNYPVTDKTLAFCISQSGETADTLRCAEKVKSKGGFVYAVTNTDKSSLARVADKCVNVYAGGEYAVASTKAYNCQLTTLLLLFVDISVARGAPEVLRAEVEGQIDRAACAVAAVLQSTDKIEKLADKVKESKSIFFLGRTTDYPTAEEPFPPRSPSSERSFSNSCSFC